MATAPWRVDGAAVQRETKAHGRGICAIWPKNPSAGAKVAKTCDGKTGELAEVIRELYGKYGASLSDMGDVPYLRQARNGDLFVNFAPASEVRWMDMKCPQRLRRASRHIGGVQNFPLSVGGGAAFRINAFVQQRDGMAGSRGETMPARPLALGRGERGRCRTLHSRPVQRTIRGCAL